MNTFLLFGATLTAFKAVSSEQYPRSEQVHLGYGEGNTLTVSWVTMSAYPDNADPVLYVSDSANNIPSSANTTYGYTQALSTMSRYYHHVSTLDLTPGQVYYYQPGQNASVYSFVAPDRDIATKKSVSFIAFGDQGAKGTDTANLINDMINGQQSSSFNIDFVMHIGDIGYADDAGQTNSNPKYMSIWDEWGALMEPVMSVVPYQVSPGNHENSCHEWSNWQCHEETRNFSTYRNYFSMPQTTGGYPSLLSSKKNSDRHNNNNHIKDGRKISSSSSNVNPGKYNLWYSYEVANLHVLSITTESDYHGSPCDVTRDSPEELLPYPQCGPFGEQESFVKQDLAQAAANSDIDWIIVVGHRPPYSSYHEQGPVNYDWPPGTAGHLQQFLEPLFHEYGVDLYIDGHIHAYERDYPIYQGKATQKNYDHPSATVYITSGAGGSVEGHSSAPPLKDYAGFIDGDNWGIGKVLIPNSTHLNWQFITAPENQIEDEIWIVKD